MEIFEQVRMIVGMKRKRAEKPRAFFCRGLLVVSLVSVGGAVQLPKEAFAGAWSGAGGELVGDLLNPWFVLPVERNVTAPPRKYCVARSPDFPQRIDELESLVKSAFDHWALEFSNAHNPVNVVSAGSEMREAVVVVNTRNYRRVESCSVDGVSLKFQFGFLDSEQQRGIEEYKIDVKRVIGLSVRTEYNTKWMQGKGFIYISPDRGIEPYRNEGVAEGTWEGRQGLKKLRGILIHELGHVHGLQHSAKTNSIMSSRFADDRAPRKRRKEAVMVT